MSNNEGNRAQRMKIGIIYNDNLYQANNSQRVTKIAHTISWLYLNNYVIWSDCHDFGYSMRVQDMIVKFLRVCQKAFVILTKK